jgi:hypothetical protein
MFCSLQRLWTYHQFNKNAGNQDVDEPMSTSIANHELEAVHEFVYHVSTISDNLSLEVELNRRKGEAATTLSTLTKRV